MTLVQDKCLALLLTPRPIIMIFVDCSLSYNLFQLMRQILPLEFANKRAKYVRNRR
ncbi:hypothetical protein AZO1586I_2033 [Bathymodiolus thermophilus thioautotrophic gill symbiont]|uniref:Uncharacterized protein n=1 Tax=Bathymodiolus thermophilus thioautotrophic gill symbiont TaxID=2360 RepID=A0ABN7GD76_9GAMM|nr:hypothetical protein AZO1586I_2033 [Bathymodiolus thermophilus thioautotrophic gill symbiont]